VVAKPLKCKYTGMRIKNALIPVRDTVERPRERLTGWGVGVHRGEFEKGERARNSHVNIGRQRRRFKDKGISQTMNAAW
jgi:hypothetical protein